MAAVWLLSGCATGSEQEGAPISVASTISSSEPAVSNYGNSLALVPLLVNASAAVVRQGDGRYADIYGGTVIDGFHDRIVLYATDVHEALKLVGTARRANPEIAGVSVRIVRCLYAARFVHVKVARLVSFRKSYGLIFPIFSATELPGGLIKIVASAEAMSSNDFKARLRKLVAPVPVTFRPNTDSTRESCSGRLCSAP
jgi:hypothetical protein